MPCNSKIQTVLIDLAAIQAAADTLGIQVIKHSANAYTLKNKTEEVRIERVKEGEKFTTTYFSAQGALMSQIIPAYAKEKIRAWGKTKGYTLAADGQDTGKFILTKYS